MRFANPDLILLLCVPVIIAFVGWFKGGLPIVMPFDFAVRRRGFFLKLPVYVVNCLPAGLLAVALLLLAGPLKFAPSETERLVTNIQICLDVSGSMNKSLRNESRNRMDPDTRFSVAMAAIDDFTKYRKGDAFGLTIFSQEYIHWVPLTQDLSAIRLAVPFVRPTFPTWGGTAIANGMSGCIDVLASRKTGDRMIILLTDGGSGDIQGGKEHELVKRLQDEQVKVFAVSLRDGAPVPELATIARATGGAVFTALDERALKKVFQEIDEMQKTSIIPRKPFLIDHVRPFCLAGLLLLGTYLFGSLFLRYTPW